MRKIKSKCDFYWVLKINNELTNVKNVENDV